LVVFKLHCAAARPQQLAGRIPVCALLNRGPELKGAS
jgi:hypothetical protein